MLNREAKVSVMDPESAAFQPRDDYWRLQSEMLRIQQGQTDLDDRVSRLERRNEDDSRVKNVWGASSPFPSVLGGTPQQVPLQQPTAEHFSSFDEHSSTLIGNLQLDADEEPRRQGTTSRANSVRFDETADHGHWAHASRSSIDFIPRTGSGLGGHAMSERSYSHKSDGRQSSAGQSVHSATSGRANSLTGDGPSMPPEPPAVAPGLFILGPVPAIIRCWLNTDFRHDTLEYAAVCSGSYASYVDSRLIERLGYQARVITSQDGVRKITISVYFPEAVPMFASSRSSSPDPQVPYISVDFNVTDGEGAVDGKLVHVILGSDMLRTHNADVLFSTNQLTLYDESCSKLRIPLVRPENEHAFNSLRTGVSRGEVKDQSTNGDTGAAHQSHAANQASNDTTVEPGREVTAKEAASTPLAALGQTSAGQRPVLTLSTDRDTTKDNGTGSSPLSAAPRSGTVPGAWGKETWRRDSDKSGGGDDTTPAEQRRSTSIKVLKPMKSNARGGAGNVSQSLAAGQSRYFNDGKRRVSNTGGSDSGELQWRTLLSGEKAKESAPPLAKPHLTKTPSGGANAFPWLGKGNTK